MHTNKRTNKSLQEVIENLEEALPREQNATARADMWRVYLALLQETNQTHRADWIQ